MGENSENSVDMVILFIFNVILFSGLMMSLRSALISTHPPVLVVISTFCPTIPSLTSTSTLPSTYLSFGLSLIISFWICSLFLHLIPSSHRSLPIWFVSLQYSSETGLAVSTFLVYYLCRKPFSATVAYIKYIVGVKMQ